MTSTELPQAEWPHTDDDDDDDDGPDFQQAFDAANYFVCWCGSNDGFSLTLGGKLHGMIVCNGCGVEFNVPEESA